MKWKFASHKFAARKFASGRFAGLGTNVAAITPISIDYRCDNTRPYYHAGNSRPYYKTDSTRPHYRTEAQDKWS